MFSFHHAYMMFFSPASWVNPLKLRDDLMVWLPGKQLSCHPETCKSRQFVWRKPRIQTSRDFVLISGTAKDSSRRNARDRKIT